MSAPRVWLVCGGLGFIGSHFIRMVLTELPDVCVVNYDAMTYAGNPANLADVAHHPKYAFVKGDIADAAAVARAIESYGVDAIVNFAAETHVDRSIHDAAAFLHTDVLGTYVLLDAARKARVKRFLQVSTDEVYGHVATGAAAEDAPLAPRSPYAASKAGGDLQVLAFATTFDVPVLITRGSNTYGPNQYPEKLIPLFVTNLLDGEAVPVYGDGLQERDWLHVIDHARGILRVLQSGTPGDVYNLGGGNPRTNLDITRALMGHCGRSFETHVRYVTDRPGHDRRYALDCEKAKRLGWQPVHDFADALASTVAWYRDNEAWWRPIKSGTFVDYYRKQYAELAGGVA
jgi:dTDP-glucose 4,6-dehydratase